MQTKRAQIQALRQAVDDVRRIASAQALIIDDITTVQSTSATYRGNAYTTYSSAVTELARKYEGTANWGVIQTGNIIDVRAAFIIGQGVSVYPKDRAKAPADKEMEFVHDFLEYNEIDREVAQEYAKEAEIEGRFLGQLFWDEKDKMVSVRFLSWTFNNYEIVTDPNDYTWIKNATWIPKGGGNRVTIEEPEFVYARFAGRVHQPELPYPKVAKCLGQLEALDKALKDWAEITRLFASPIPHIECETPEQASYMKDAITSVASNWKIKKLFAHTGKLMYTSPDAAGIAYLEKLIIMLAKMISGTTGCPVGLMGLGDLTTKLGSSSEITADQLSATTSKEREIWVGTYTQLIGKAMEMWNSHSAKQKLDPESIQVSIPFVTNETWKRIGDIWLPLYMGGGISLKTMLSKIPDIDVEAEMEAKEGEAEANMERFKKGAIPPKDDGKNDKNDKNNKSDQNIKDGDEEDAE